MSIVNKAIKNGFSLDEFEPDCLSFEEKIQSVDGISSEGNKITTHYLSNKYTYTNEKEDGTQYNKIDIPRYEWPECTITFDNIKSSTKAVEKDEYVNGKKTGNKVLKDTRKSECFANFDISNPDIARHIKVGPPRLIKIKGEEESDEGKPVPKGCLTDKKIKINDEEEEYQTCKEAEIDFVPEGYRIQHESFVEKLKGQIAKLIYKNKSKFSNLATLKRAEIATKIKPIVRLKDNNGTPDDENQNFDIKMTLIDRGEPGSYNRVETELKLPKGQEICDDEGRPIKLTYDHFKGFKVTGIPLVESKQTLVSSEGDIYWKMLVVSFVITKVEENNGEADQTLTQERVAGQTDCIALQDALKMVIANRKKRSETEKSMPQMKISDEVKNEETKIKEESKDNKVSTPEKEKRSFPLRAVEDEV